MRVQAIRMLLANRGRGVAAHQRIGELQVFE
jgi:hypothetical protein